MLESVQLSLTSARLHQIQAEMIATFTDSHHGKINPMLLSPSQIKAKLAEVKNHLRTSLELPVSKDNILQLYNVMNVKGLQKTTPFFTYIFCYLILKYPNF